MVRSSDGGPQPLVAHAGRRIADILAGCPSGQSLLRKRIASTAAGSGATAASFSSETETSP